MRLTHLANQRVIITRMTAVSGFKQAHATVTAAFGHIQPVSAEKTQSIGGVFGKTFRIFMDGDSGIQEGDMLRDEASRYYKVRAGGVSRRTYGAMDFSEVIIEQVS